MRRFGRASVLPALLLAWWALPAAPAGAGEPPLLVTATVERTEVSLWFNESLASASSLANSSFHVRKNRGGADETLTGSPTIVSGRGLELTLATAAKSSDSFTVAYTRPTSGTNNRIVDAEGSETATFDAVYAINSTHGLVATKVTGTTATLLSVNFVGAIYYRQTAPGTGSCAGLSRPQGLTGLTANTSHTYKAYSDSACSASNETASVTFTTRAATDATAPTLTGASLEGDSTTSLVLTFSEALASSASLANSSFSVRKNGGASDESLTGSPTISSSTANTVTLTLGTAAVHSDTFTVAYDKPTSGTNNRIEDAAGNETASFSARNVRNSLFGVAVRAIVATGARLVVHNVVGRSSWSHRRTAPNSGSCQNVSTDNTAIIAGLSANSSYTYEVYESLNCADAERLSSVTFTTLASHYVSNLGQTALSSSVSASYLANAFTTGGSATDRFILTSVIIDFPSTNPGSAPTVGIYTVSSGDPGTRVGGNLVRQGTGVPTGQTTYNAPSAGITLSGGTTYFVRSAGSGVLPWHSRTSSNSEDSGSTANWSIGDVYKVSTSGTLWADDGSGRSLLFRVNAVTRPGLSADKVTQTGARLTIANHGAAWYYKSTAAGASCSSQVAMGTTRVTLTGLTANTAYVYKAYSNSTCATELTANASDAEFTTLDLTATNIGQTTARVSIVNLTGGWHLRRTAPSTGTCVPLASTQHFQNLINLTANTSYTYRAYLLAGCPTSSEIASVTFMTLVGDTTPPSVVAGGYSPADNSTGVGTNANLVLTFNEAVQKGTGNINVNTDAIGAVNLLIAVTSNQVSIGGTNNTVVTINPTNDLSASTAYRVRIPSGAFKDSANNNYAGINDNTTWNFQTAAAPDTTPPQLASNPFSPADDAAGVALNANLRVTFNENVQLDTSKWIRLWAAGGSSATPIAVSVSGATVTIDPASDLAAETAHSVVMQSGAIEDLAGNDYAGFESDHTVWNFTTGAAADDGGGDGDGGGGGGGDDSDGDGGDSDGDGEEPDPDAPCARRVAPYWHGEAVLLLRSADGLSVQVETTCGNVTASHAEFGELIVREASCKDAGGAPRVGSLAVTGAAPGGWYYVRGARNVAVAPLMCASRFEGETVKAATVGGTMTTRSDRGTFVSHDATRLIGIVPDLPAGGTGSLRAPYWRGWGGVVGKAADGEGVDVEYGCLVVPLRERLSADPETGVVSALLRPANCRSEDGRSFAGQLTVSGMEDGGWYWLDGPSGGSPAVAPLVRSSLLDEDVEPVDPGNPNVTIHRGRHGTLFEDTKNALSGVVPHLED